MWQGLRPGDPDRIGPYQLRGVLGAGGMGQVYLGAAADGQLAAVKVIRAELATDAEFRARFSREVSVARQVTSPFTAALLDADADGPMPWLATAYVPGPSLADAVTEHGPLPAPSVRELAAGLAAGLSAIHAAGVVHRDLKPSNVLLAPDGPRIIDFGISVAAAASPLTRTGLLIGSPGYMSPEQVEGREVGPASDIFSLGTVLAFAATGDAPFGSGSVPTLAYRALYQEVNLGRVPAEVRGLIESCLAKDPLKRPTAHELMSGPVTIPPTQRSEPAPPRTVTSRAEMAGPSSMTVTTARPTPVPGAAPAVASATAGGRAVSARGIRAKRRLPRSLAVTALVAGVLGASAVGGVALASSGHQGSGVHVMQTGTGHPPVKHPVMGQAVMGRMVTSGMASPTAAPATSAANATPVMATASAGTAPAASPSATATAPASPTTAPAVSSSTAPAVTSSTAPATSPASTPATGSPAATGAAMTPAPAAS